MLCGRDTVGAALLLLRSTIVELVRVWECDGVMV